MKLSEDWGGDRRLCVPGFDLDRQFASTAVADPGLSKVIRLLSQRSVSGHPM